MIKLTVLYHPPADPAAFDNYYFDKHKPLADTLPGLVRQEISKVSGTLGSGAAPYHLLCELYFESQDALMAALGSPIGQAVAADVANYAMAGVTMVVSEIAET